MRKRERIAFSTANETRIQKSARRAEPLFNVSQLLDQQEIP